MDRALSNVVTQQSTDDSNLVDSLGSSIGVSAKFDLGRLRLNPSPPVNKPAQLPNAQASQSSNNGYAVSRESRQNLENPASFLI